MTPEEDRRRAQHYLELAKATTDPALSSSFQMLAAEYLEMVEKAEELDPIAQQPVAPEQQAAECSGPLTG